MYQSIPAVPIPPGPPSGFWFVAISHGLSYHKNTSAQGWGHGLFMQTSVTFDQLHVLITLAVTLHSNCGSSFERVKTKSESAVNIA